MTDIEYSRKERSISSWISMGSIDTTWPLPPASVDSSVPTPPASSGGPPRRRPPPDPRVAMFVCRPLWCTGAPVAVAFSEVEEADVLGVRLDEGATQVHVVAHEHRADLVGEGRLLDGDLEQRTLARLHGRVAQFVE